MASLSVLNGALVNAIGVIVGSGLGVSVGKKIPQRISTAMMCALGFCTLYIGITGSLKGENTLIVILSLVIGTAIGEWADLDKWIHRFGEKVEIALHHDGKKQSVAEGFVNASLLFCVGAMTIVGSLNSGLSGDHTTLYAKSLLDFVAAIVFSSTMGIGVALSAVVVFLLQGSISLLANIIAPFLGSTVIAEVTCVGSLLIIGLSLNLLGITKLKIMNFVPGIFLPIGLCPLVEWIQTVLAR